MFLVPGKIIANRETECPHLAYKYAFVSVILITFKFFDLNSCIFLKVDKLT